LQARSRKSYVLVGLQFLALIVIGLTGPLLAKHPLLLAMEIAGFALAAWALWSMRVSPPNVTPDVRPSATLVAHGPYRWIRHPMYSSLILITLALVLDSPSPQRWVTWLLLVATLVVKLNYEEKLLASHFATYSGYVQGTKRLIPFVY
jgi:protein-S-isoprenylcysteine O-methyltransferase Ste14